MHKGCAPVALLLAVVCPYSPTLANTAAITDGPMK
jgi:hypothetical protein